MAVAYVNSLGSGVGVASLAVTHAAASGSLVVVRVNGSSAPLGSITDARSNAYTRIWQGSYGGFAFINEIWCSVLTTGLLLSDLINFNAISSNTAINLDNFSGVASNAASTAYASNAASGTSANAQVSVTTSANVQSGDLVLGTGAMNNAGGTITEQGGAWTTLTQHVNGNSYPSAGSWKTGSGGKASFSPTLNAAGGAYGIGVIALPTPRTYTDTATGNVLFAGSTMDAITFTDATSGDIVFSGSASEVFSGPPTFTDAMSGNIVFGGSGVESFNGAPTFTDAMSGNLIFLGSAAENFIAPSPPGVKENLPTRLPPRDRHPDQAGWTPHRRHKL